MLLFFVQWHFVIDDQGPEEIMTCQDCDGIGAKLTSIPVDRGGFYAREFECNSCDGSGRICESCGQPMAFDETRNDFCQSCVGAIVDEEGNVESMVLS